MVIYEYRCPGCNQRIEAFHPMGEAPDSMTCDCNTEAKRTRSRGEFLSFDGSYKASKQPKP